MIIKESDAPVERKFIQSRRQERRKFSAILAKISEFLEISLPFRNNNKKNVFQKLYNRSITGSVET